MKILGINVPIHFGKLKSSPSLSNDISIKENESQNHETRSNYYYGSQIIYDQLIWDGEKEPGELGRPLDVSPVKRDIALRAREMTLKTAPFDTLIDKTRIWTVGTGLNFMYDPNDYILNYFGVKIKEREGFVSLIENLFAQFLSDKNSSYNKQSNLHELASDVIANTKIDGDIVHIIRYSATDGVTVELVSGLLVENDPMDTDGDFIEGIKYGPKNEHLAYCIRQKEGQYSKINCYTKSGLRQAILVKGQSNDLFSDRGISSFAQTLSVNQKADEFLSAITIAATEDAKIVMSIEHDLNAEGKNPFNNAILKNLAIRENSNQNGQAQSSLTDLNVKTIAATTTGQVVNMEPGSHLEKKGNEVTKHSPELWHRSVVDDIYSAYGYAPEFVRSNFQASYSAAMGAMGVTSRKISVDRETIIVSQFYRYIFAYWFEVMCLKDIIKCDDFLNGNRYVRQAFLNCDFLGTSLPHMDPVKAVKAARERLGPAYKDIPISTAETECRELGLGDFEKISKNSQKEVADSKYFTTLASNLEQKNNSDTKI